jgi:hypothetical protein
MKNVSHVVEKIWTHIIRSITFFFSEIVPFMRYVEKYGTTRQVLDEQVIRWIHFVCWISKATDKHSEYEIIIAFPQQKWLCECASLLCVHVRASLFMISVNNTRPYQNNGKNALHLSHDLFHFPLQHTSLYSPPVFFPMSSHECEHWSHTEQVLAVKG